MSRNKKIDDFMQTFPYEGLTFDDVSLVTQYADFLPNEADITSPLTSRITLNMPFISAAMDTVTEARLAIAMAMLGGIGVIHKNLAAEKQAEMVRTVKVHLNGLITKPITFHAADTLKTVAATRKAKGYAFSGFPILDEQEQLVGILTTKDIKFTRSTNAKLADVMTRELITAPPDTTLKQAFDIMMKKRIGKLPLVDKKGKLVGLYSFSDVRTLIQNVEPMYNRDAQYRLRVAAAVGPNDQARVDILARSEVDAVVVDTAHGHSLGVIEMTKWVRKHYPDLDVIAGNIATGAAALALRDAGATAVKVGIGPGSICTTRVVAGVGVPQVSAIYACAQALNGSIPVIADGGIRFSGDVAKALDAGASAVMMGGVLAGTEESPGEKIFYQSRQYVSYRGMGSLGAMQAGQGSRERYGQAETQSDELVPQGIEGIVPYAGTVKQVLTQFSGGLKASMGYCGCRTLTELRERAEFIRVTAAGQAEAHPHDIKITKEAPNYRL
ncbi:MAG: IMP dehydrogenase [Kiritimatiellaeota bacterium]|nr:IMP dehydrogenase [Kiritimatiellota bacterium]